MTDTHRADVTDIFSAASWFDDLWNSTARAVSPSTLEWQCCTYGSGKGRAYWEYTAIFDVVVAMFDLPTESNWSGRDELIVTVPLELVPAIMEVIECLDQDDPSSWPWMDEDVAGDRKAQIAVAAESLGVLPEDLACNDKLLRLLRIDH